nr:macro domain-containing protein [Oscillospiraceae bacterium]
LLASCYRSALALAAEAGCESVAFPLISAGIFGYPKAEALQVATETITDFLREHDMTVYLTLFGRSDFVLSRERYGEVQRFLDDNYEAESADSTPQKTGFRPKAFARAERKQNASAANEAAKACAEAAFAALPSALCLDAAAEPDASLEELIGALDESFSQMLLRKIDEKGMKDADCYKRANVDRKHFSKIRSDVHYRPSKPTALAFAVALELSLDETAELLRKAGYALSRSSKFDVIVEYCIRKGVYSVYEINETLFAFDQTLLGTVR